MNYTINNIPKRTTKPRTQGLTMIMDRGLSIREVEDFISMNGEYVDIVKLGWSTSYLTPMLRKKLKVYEDAGIPCYFGGTLFEAFIVRNRFEEYQRILDDYEVPFAEVSDGSIDMPHDQKLEYIAKLSKQVKVLSEVGSKDVNKIIPPYLWIEFMQKELNAGAWKVIGEARESGNVGLFRASGEVRSGLVQEVLTKISFDKIIWEAPQKAQQAWFIKLLGANVNLGNIAPSDAIPLETLRLGLRGDTFLHFLKPATNNKIPPFHTE